MSGAGPSLYPGELPSWSVWKFPPDPAPAPIPPPFEDYSFKTPFPIPADLYRDALSFKVPLTIASVYATSVFFLNWWNRNNGNKPWKISKTRPFKAFVLAHNIFLAVYSAVTCVAMVRALKHSIPHYTEHNAVVGAIDALCKMHGPRGLGDAITYNTEQNIWQSKSRFVQLDNGVPDSTDVGRVWNEGLAWWGWIFYLSKFYEVLDTAIIIAKGKRSTTLQTYHHAGAMLSMWAGIRYMSPPIWMFALVNSGIHAMMYTYYTVSALGVRVPQFVKRSLTSLQILQFLVGASFAAIHIFVSYTVPVSVPYQLSDITSSASSVVSSATNSVPMTVATGAAVAFLKKLVYRAAGEEGLAENIHYPGGDTYHHINQPQQVLKDAVRSTVYRTEYQTVPCIDTSGQAFAIYLNLIYLAPLTGLFMRFFVKSYIRRTAQNNKHRTKRNSFTKATRDAIHGVDREIESLGRSAEDGIATGVNSVKSTVRGRASQANGLRAGSLSPANQKFVESFQKKVNNKLEEIGEGAEASKQRARKVAKDLADSVGSPKRDRSTNGDTNGNANGELKEKFISNSNGNANGGHKEKSSPNGDAEKTHPAANGEPKEDSNSNGGPESKHPASM